jgi:hypothetical protein
MLLPACESAGVLKRSRLRGGRVTRKNCAAFRVFALQLLSGALASRELSGQSCTTMVPIPARFICSAPIAAMQGLAVPDREFSDPAVLVAADPSQKNEKIRLMYDCLSRRDRSAFLVPGATSMPFVNRKAQRISSCAMRKWFEHKTPVELGTGQQLATVAQTSIRGLFSA